ncbi:uncharacterized protein [Diadema antillarum]|uniref:uncharacterized protein n=1 Tax=Diadema antillarum TaxID=105358 RepID=UPI003A846836
MSELDELSETDKVHGRYQPGEIQLLCKYVRENYQQLHPKTDKPNTKARLAHAWRQAAISLMSQGFPLSKNKKKEDGPHLRDLWHQMVSRAKKYRDQRRQTGGGPRPKFHERHEMVLETIPSQCQTGFIGIEAEAGDIIALLGGIDGTQELPTQQDRHYRHEQQEQQHGYQPQHQPQQQHLPQQPQPQPQPQQDQQPQQPQPQHQPQQDHQQQQPQPEHQPQQDHQLQQQHQPQHQAQQHYQPQQLHQPQQQHHQPQQQHHRHVSPNKGRKRQGESQAQLDLIEIEREKLEIKRQKLEVEREQLEVEREQLKVMKEMLAEMQNGLIFKSEL